MEAGEILVIDLFAGPGGLGEGISSCTTKNGIKPFAIGMSVEKELSAHKTLTEPNLRLKIKLRLNNITNAQSTQKVRL